MKNRIRKIPATKNLYHNKEKAAKRRRRVAAYARVSTDHEDQVKSCRAQVDYYTRLIKGREDWDFDFWVLKFEEGKYFWEKAARYQFEPGTAKELFLSSGNK